MDIEKLVSELTERWFSSSDLREIMAREVTALIREAVAEAIAENDREWKKTYDEAVNNPPGYLIKVVDASKEVRGG